MKRTFFAPYFTFSAAPETFDLQNLFPITLMTSFSLAPSVASSSNSFSSLYPLTAGVLAFLLFSSDSTTSQGKPVHTRDFHSHDGGSHKHILSPQPFVGSYPMPAVPLHLCVLYTILNTTSEVGFFSLLSALRWFPITFRGGNLYVLLWSSRSQGLNNLTSSPLLHLLF